MNMTAAIKEETPYLRTNLVVLMYSENNCYTTVVVPDDPRVTKAGVIIDEAHGTWKFTGTAAWDIQNPVRQIGKGYVRQQGSRWGVIGVFDRTSLDQLDSMNSYSKEATADRHFSEDD
jgi:hypothetical protein